MNREREYGKALGLIKERKECLIEMEGYAEYVYQRKAYNELWNIDDLIRDAWKKRAVCRRRCVECVIYHEVKREALRRNIGRNYSSGLVQCGQHMVIGEDLIPTDCSSFTPVIKEGLING